MVKKYTKDDLWYTWVAAVKNKETFECLDWEKERLDFDKYIESKSK